MRRFLEDESGMGVVEVISRFDWSGHYFPDTDSEDCK